MTIVAWTWLATPVVGSLPAGERATGLGRMMSTMMPDAHFVPLSQAIPLPGPVRRLSAPLLALALIGLAFSFASLRRLRRSLS
jgi:hypothetical protein